MELSGTEPLEIGGLQGANRRIKLRLVLSKLFSWHSRNFGKYAFRNERDPYKILVAEILLRQTTARQVQGIYPRFIAAYPNLCTLATADPAQVRALLRPLGIKSRASNLLKIGKVLAASNCGRVPANFDMLVSLPGVGSYIANSVLARGYGQHLPLVDSNVNRVLARVFEAKDKVAAEVAEGIFTNLLRYVKPEQLNYAVIDLAHSFCTHANPRCRICPIRNLCKYATASGIA